MIQNDNLYLHRITTQLNLYALFLDFTILEPLFPLIHCSRQLMICRSTRLRGTRSYALLHAFSIGKTTSTSL